MQSCLQSGRVTVDPILIHDSCGFCSEEKSRSVTVMTQGLRKCKLMPTGLYDAAVIQRCACLPRATESVRSIGSLHWRESRGFLWTACFLDSNRKNQDSVSLSSVKFTQASISNSPRYLRRGRISQHNESQGFLYDDERMHFVR